MARMNVAHIVNQHNGHNPDISCWCEPVEIRWVTNKYGIKVLIVCHDDLISPLIHHHDVLESRDAAQDWITQVLNEVHETEGVSDGDDE